MIAVEAIVGALLPTLIDFLNRNVEDKKVRYWISLIISLAVAVGLNWSDLNWQDVLSSGAIIFTAAQTVYKQYWGSSDLRTMIVPESTLKARE